jgi:Ser/Thr protein kinase RdoA (MazF antagonist)
MVMLTPFRQSTPPATSDILHPMPPQSPPVFATQSKQAQIQQLRRVAQRALQGFDLREPEFRLLNHGFNTVFRVDTADNQRFALRLNVNSRRSLENLRAEVSWLQAIAQDTELSVPKVEPTSQGQALQVLDSPEVGRPVPAVLFHWLSGPNINKRLRTTNMFHLGKAMAVLHEHAEHWVLPPGSALACGDQVLLTDPNRLASIDNAVVPGHALNDERRVLFLAVLEQAQAMLNGLYAQAKPHALHFDLHPWNLKWYRQHLSIFDFDDSAIGIPAQDFSTFWYYLRQHPKHQQLAEQVCAGYETKRTLPIPNTHALETLVAARSLLLANDIVGNENPEIRNYTPKFFANTEVRLRHFLEHGVFDASITAPQHEIAEP